MNRTPTILVLGAGRNQLPMIEAAKRKGLRVVTIDPSPDAPGFEAADAAFACDLGNLEECLRVAQEHRVRGVVTLAAEYPVPTLAYLCETLDLPGIRRETAALATNKARMRQAFAAAVPQPKFACVSCVDEARWPYASSVRKRSSSPPSATVRRGLQRWD